MEDGATSFVLGADDGRYAAMTLCEIAYQEDKIFFRIKEMAQQKIAEHAAFEITDFKSQNSVFSVNLSINNQNMLIEINEMEVGSCQIPSEALGSIGYFQNRGTKYGYLDNILVKTGEKTVFKEDFSAKETIFSPYHIQVEEGQLKTVSGILLTPGRDHPAPIFRRDFEVQNKEIQSARIYMTALGAFDLQLNGETVSEEWLSPGKLAYNQYLTYVTYDVTNLLYKEETNTLGAVLYHGWYDRAVGYVDIFNPWGDTNALYGSLRITYTDGSQEVIGTDSRYMNPDQFIMVFVICRLQE